jgi:hypothetical protein
MHPVLDTFLRALPHRYRAVNAPDGACVALTIEGEAGGEWALAREGGAWRLFTGRPGRADASVFIAADAAWRLFTKDSRAASEVRIDGNRPLGEPFLSTVAVMA